MTKADVINEIAKKTGIEKVVVTATVEAFMKTVKDTMAEGENVYMRGFGTFLVKRRAEKLGRNITAKTTVLIPAHNIAAFKAAKSFSTKMKKSVKKVKKERKAK
jgi:DNA-binding protein HU-beta